MPAPRGNEAAYVLPEVERRASAYPPGCVVPHTVGATRSITVSEDTTQALEGLDQRDAEPWCQLSKPSGIRDLWPAARSYRLMTLWISTISGGPASSIPPSRRIGIRR